MLREGVNFPGHGFLFQFGEKRVILGFLRSLRDFFKGLFLYNLYGHFHAQKRCLENVFMLGLFGPMIGVPHLFQYYSLRLLPYYVRDFPAWKRRMVKERDFFDQVGE